MSGTARQMSLDARPSKQNLSTQQNCLGYGLTTRSRGYRTYRWFRALHRQCGGSKMDF